MNETKYYVRLRPMDTYLIRNYPSKKDVRWVDEVKQAFTKSELSEFMDGALYKQTLSEDILTPDHVYYGSGKEIVEEWINPLIELIPSEPKYCIGLLSPLYEDAVTHYLWEDSNFHPCFEKPSCAITLKKLADITKGKLAKDVSYVDKAEIGLVGKVVDGYWVNPLIMLSLAEDE